ncbi:non-ribosomal peptide synthetase, partial [Paenibacillus xylaniclasticus]|uniref:non-ribosomal peptide synthetase n=1 Tax=Paenibacillus xylaniclasticus TaxID=588083 RepID=UPI0013DF7659
QLEDKQAVAEFEDIPQAVSAGDGYPMTTAQKRLYFLHLLQDEKGIEYNVTKKVKLTGALDRARLERAVNKLVMRHEALRTTFAMEGEEWKQHVRSDLSIAVQWGEGEADAFIRRLVRPFDLQTGPLIRVGVVKIGENEHVLALDMHHIICDGVSVKILMEELFGLYEGRELPEPGVQYKDYAAWQNGKTESAEMKQHRDYWKQVFEGEIPKLELPLDQPRPAIKSYEGGQVFDRLDAKLSRALKELGERAGATLYMVLLAGYHVLLAKYARQQEIVIGTPVSGRNHIQIERTVGLFVNTIAIRGQSSPEESYMQWLERIKAGVLEAFEHQEYPFDELVGELDVERDMSRNPLYDTLFSLQPTQIEELKTPGLKIERYELEETTAKLDLSVYVTEEADGLRVCFEYNRALLTRETATRMMGHYKRLLERIVVEPEKRLSEISLLSEEEKRELLEVFNRTDADYPKDRTIHQLFEEQVERTPGEIAVIGETEQWSYAELNERANRIAHILQSRGVGDGDVVAVMQERSPLMVASILGILKSGSAYLPLDAALPAERLQYMVSDSRAKAVVTALGTVSKAEELGIEMVLADGEETSQAATSNPEPASKPEDLAYVIYTSGSTGRPKGVIVEHRSV